MTRLPIVLRIHGDKLLDRETSDKIKANWRRAVREGVAVIDHRVDVLYPPRSPIRAKHGHTPRWVNR